MMMIAGSLLGFIGMFWLMAMLEDRMPAWKMFLLFLFIWVGGALFGK